MRWRLPVLSAVLCSTLVLTSAVLHAGPPTDPNKAPAVIKAKQKYDQAVKSEETARQQMNDAEKAYNEAIARLQASKSIPSVAGITDLSDAAKQAQEEVDRAQQRAKKNLIQNKPEYATTKQAYDEARERVQRLQENANSDPADVAEASGRMLELEAKLTDFEKEGLDGDPEVKKASEKLKAAQDKVNAERRAQIAKVSNNTDKAQITGMQATVDQARKAYFDAKRATVTARNEGIAAFEKARADAEAAKKKSKKKKSDKK